ncbi:hypothetical protein L6452_14314 [Arctium lappa]|uniref:Uncharacterized protein n=1 Tax=Arctium lappa TaxID=4217 RepID=A0ACB9CKR1_ARCLA|nr:hypothetical protein L6452_14314 [Arctium lappa]
MLEIDGGTKSMRIIQQEECNSSSSSSIGDDNDEDRDGDVESRYRYDHHNNNGSFDDAIQALEEALPIRSNLPISSDNEHSIDHTLVEDVAGLIGAPIMSLTDSSFIVIIFFAVLIDMFSSSKFNATYSL